MAFSSNVYAAPETAGTITKLYLKRDDGLVYFKLSSTTPTACSSVNSGNPFKFYTTSTAGKELYATMLSAYMANKTIKIGYTGGTTTHCHALYAYFN